MTTSIARRRPLALRAALLCAALALAPAAASAAVSVTATLPALPAPFANAVTAWQTSSSLTVRITNTGDQAAHRIDVRMPNNGYGASGGTAPGAGWTVSTTTSGGIDVVRFDSACAAAGLAPGATADFVVSLVTPRGATAADTVTSAFLITAGTSSCATPAQSGTATFTAPVKVLFVSADAPADVLGLTGTVAWTVENLSSVTQTGITLTTVVSPAAGATATCTTLSSLGAYASGTITCTYQVPAAGSYQLAASASNAAGTATAAGAYASGSFVSTAPAWPRPVVVRGRSGTYTLTFTLANSSARITRLDVTYPSASGWAFTSPLPSSSSGLSYSSANSSAGNAVFTGSLGLGGSTTITLPFTSVPGPTSTTAYTFGVKMTNRYGDTATVAQQVTVVVPISDVAGLTIRASAAGQALAWTNTSANGSAHDGVVIFRAAAGSTPATPADFATYTAGSGGVVFADGAGGTAATFTDATVGSYNYRVCNRDAYRVYSSCSTGFWNGLGWLDSEAYPSGGWVHALNGSAVVRPGFLTGNRLGVASNGPFANVLDIATGARAFAPVSITSLPSNYTPAMQLSNGRKVWYAADQGGGITAVDLDTGAVYWQVTKSGESFTAGLSGIVRWASHADFAAAYPNDVLIAPSTSGRVYAVDTTTGATLWTFAAGAGVYALVNYDAGTNLLYVATAGAGVRAFSLAGTGPGTPPGPAAWTSPDAAGIYRYHCVPAAGVPAMACVTTTGVVRILNVTTGALLAPPYQSAITTPTSLSRVSGGTATPGLVVVGASSAQILSATGTPFTISSLGTWAPGLTISPALVRASAGSVVFGASDRRLHRLALANAAQQAQSAQVGTQSSGVNLGPPLFDTATNLYLFGTSDGHIWALPAF